MAEKNVRDAIELDIHEFSSGVNFRANSNEILNESQADY